MCIAVDYRFAGDAQTRALVRAMEHEATSIWEAYDVHLLWPVISGRGPCRRVTASFDVLVKRRIEPIARRSDGAVLGRTQIGAGSIVHVPIVIDYDATQRIVESLTRERLVAAVHRPYLHSSDIGRALGRVLAHEIGHVLLADARHRRRGLMRSAFRADDLVTLESRAFALSAEDLQRLWDRRRQLAGGGRSTASVTADLGSPSRLIY